MEKLKKDIKSSYQASDAEIDAAIFRARCDYVKETDGSAKYLLKAFPENDYGFDGARYVEAAVRATHAPTLRNRQNLIDCLKELVDPQKEFDSKSFRAFVTLINNTCSDEALFKAMDQIIENRTQQRSSADVRLSK
jgi:hypothetical protein